MNRDMPIIYLLISLACLIISTAAKLQGEGIIQGHVAKPEQFLYQVAIFTNGQQICGGGIIDDRFVLTAAHCVINWYGNFTGEPLTIIAGINDLEKVKEAISIPVEKIYAHAKFNQQTSHWSSDIAVLKLKQSLNLSEHNLKKLKLPINIQETYMNKQATIAGFGYDTISTYKDHQTKQLQEFGSHKDYKLKYVVSKIIGRGKCQNRLGVHRPILDSHLCASAKQDNYQEPSGVCSGDSGGPLVFRKETVIGIVSTSPIGCTEAWKPAVYTRVSSFLDFIENSKKDNVTKDIRVYDF